MGVLHRIEALPGLGRYSVSFQRSDGAEQTVVIEVSGDEVSAAEAGLPAGWTRGSEAFLALTRAIVAVEQARGIGPRAAALADVDGGWDVMMGNVLLTADGVPTCTAHGPMSETSGYRYTCAGCGARASYDA